MAALFHRAVGQEEHQRDKRDKIHDVGQADDAVGEVAQPRRRGQEAQYHADWVEVRACARLRDNIMLRQVHQHVHAQRQDGGGNTFAYFPSESSRIASGKRKKVSAFFPKISSAFFFKSSFEEASI